MTITRLSRRAHALLILPLLAIAAACGSDTKAAPTTSVAATSSAAPAATAASAPDSSASPTTATAPDLSGVTLRIGDQVSITQSGLEAAGLADTCLLYTSPSPRDGLLSRMPSSA